jgi:CheY-like chemotaxis protein
MSQPEGATAAIHRLRRVRVLLVGTDARFLRVAGALLAGEGHVVQTSERPTDLLELVYRLQTDVAVIDASASLPQAARAAASLQALPNPVAAVLVADQDRIPSVGPAVVPKWGCFDELAERVHGAYEWRRHARVTLA